MSFAQQLPDKFNLALFFRKVSLLIRFVFAALYFKVEATEYICESISTEQWRLNSSTKTCLMNERTKINNANVTLTCRMDESINGLRLDSNKQISYLPVEVVKVFPNLVGYEASFCSIKTVEKANFENLSKLKELWLHYNQIESIASGSFDGLHDLLVLALGMKMIIIKLRLIFRI